MHHLQHQMCSPTTFATKKIKLFCSWPKIQGGSHTVDETTFYNFDSSNGLAMDCH
jgi:hypothetical protein